MILGAFLAVDQSRGNVDSQREKLSSPQPVCVVGYSVMTYESGVLKMQKRRAMVVVMSVCGLAVSAAGQDRTIDGSGNNVGNASMGAAHTDQIRLGSAHYTDGLGGMIDRGNPRVISNAVSTQTRTGNDQGLSSMFWQWGQFLDHDLVLTETGAEFAPIFAPAGDPAFAPGEMIPFTRSIHGGGVAGPRTFPNGITHYLDGSMVYGSDNTRADAMRTMSGGRMTMGVDNMMMRNDADLHVANDSGLFDNTEMFLAGDIRATEQTGLAAMHTVFAREHNRWADRLAGDLDLTGLDAAQADELIYQTARKIVGAEIQKITYEEWLPAMLGGDGLGSYQGYDGNVDASVSVEFSTAAFRFGHTMINDQLLRLNADGTDFAGGHLGLLESFFNPETLDESVELDALLRGLAAQEANEFDTQVVDDARNFLFGAPGSGAGGLDLMSLNIQRGRDHGIGTYNDVRASMGLSEADDFLDITGGDVDIANQLASVYATVDDVDAIIGMFAEAKVDGAAAGETVSMIIADQFARLRDGDRFFYLNDLDLLPYLDEIEATTLGDILALNSDATFNGNVFYIPAPSGVALLGMGGLLASRRRR